MKKQFSIVLVLVLLLSILGCEESLFEREGGDSMNTDGPMSINKEPFGSVDGKAVDLYTLTNANGLVAKITTYGGIMTELWVPDKNGEPGDILLGYDSVDKYVAGSPYFGALIGRYGNRIGKGKFTLGGREYTLATNDNDINHLHGGVKGFDKVIWTAKPVKTSDGVGLELKYTSKDGEEGYPGTLKATVVYMLTNDNELTVEYWATTNKMTVCNLTQHNYYNLGGHASGKILDHQLMLNSDFFTPTDSGLIPTGQILKVAGTPMDFNKATAIGARVNTDYEPLKFGGGYDHNWILDKGDMQGKMTLAAVVTEPQSGRTMEIWTDQPAIQFYCGNFLDGSNVGKGGVPYEHRTGFCLETQHYPDSPNHSHFPSTTLLPGQEYNTKTVHKFYAK